MSKEDLLREIKDFAISKGKEIPKEKYIMDWTDAFLDDVVILPENWTIRLVKKLKFKFNQDYERKTQKIQFAVQGKCCH